MNKNRQTPYLPNPLTTLFENDRMSEIHDAAGQGDVLKITPWIRKTPGDLERPDSLGNHPLHVAAYSGQVEAVELLLKLGANINARGDMRRTPLHYAALEEEPCVAEVLITHKADLAPVDAHGFTPLFYTVQGRGLDSETAEVLLRNTVPVDLNSAIWFMNINQLRERFKVEPNAVDAAPNSLQLVPDASSNADIEIVNLLLEFGAPINGSPSYRSLISAFRFPQIVRLLLERGADPTLLDSSGISILRKALELKASEEVLGLLRQFGAGE